MNLPVTKIILFFIEKSLIIRRSTSWKVTQFQKIHFALCCTNRPHSPASWNGKNVINTVIRKIARLRYMWLWHHKNEVNKVCEEIYSIISIFSKAVDFTLLCRLLQLHAKLSTIIYVTLKKKKCKTSFASIVSLLLQVGDMIISKMLKLCIQRVNYLCVLHELHMRFCEVCHVWNTHI